jgi:hypothetical protein
MENSMKFLKNFHTTLGICPKECKSIYKTYACMLMLIAALFLIAELWNQPRCPTSEEWMKTHTHTHTHTHTRVLLLSKKEK